MQVLLTRPENDAARTAERLSAFGHVAVIAPVLSISPTDARLPTDGFDALVATSANAQLAFRSGVPEGWKSLPLFVVGDRTAEPFRALGFERIHAADGDATSLAALIRAHAAPAARLLYLAGTDRKPTLEGALIDAGFALTVLETYRAEAAPALPVAAAEALRAGTLDAVLHYSRRSAEILFALASHERLVEPLKSLRHLCLSEDVARGVRGLGGATVEAAPGTGEASLLALLDAEPGHSISERIGGGDAGGEAITSEQAGSGGAARPERSIMAETDQRGGGSRKRGGTRREPDVLDLTAETLAGGASAAPAEVAPAAGDIPTPATETTNHAEASPEPLPPEAPGDETPPFAPPAGETETSTTAAATADEPAPELAAATTSVPSAGRLDAPTRSADRSSGALVPAVAGLVGGLIGAGVVALALYVWSGASDINERLTQLETGVGEKATRRTLEALEKRVGANEAALQGSRADLDGLAKRLPADPATALAQLTERLDKVENGVTTLESRPAAPAIAPAPPPPPPVPALGARESAVLTVAWLVRDDLGRAQPYARELNALKAAKADAAAVTALEPFADKGAPTVAQLSAQFAPLAEKLASPAPAPQQGSAWERIQARIAGLYKVRPLGEAAGESSAAIAARADAALKRGDLAAAVAELDKLPADDKAAIKPFLDLAQARLSAGRAADALVATAADQVLAATQSGGAAR
ncbi:uroporphyrinogen-III synthase [Alsobacter metallidurans]|nr:uroporphyrinogen-III synthase [Alsobacter metallidurans]